jgi:hypothetical protein
MTCAPALIYSHLVRSSSLPLRLLVGLGLVFNGPGYGSATSMTVMPDAAPVGAATHGAMHADDALPCPGHADSAPADEPQTGDSTTTHRPAQPEHGTPGCCGSGACAGSCTVHAPASVAQWMSTAVPVHDAALRPMNIAHASPALPPRIRPPIA